MQLAAVIVGGVLATAGGIVTTLVVERQKRRHDAAQLALAFKGEIAALVRHVEERNYLERITQVMRRIEEGGELFHMRLRLRFQYDRVYDNNVDRIGVLSPPLPERLPLFYTRLNSVLEDFVNMAEGSYADLDRVTLLRVYGDLRGLIERMLQDGKELVELIDSPAG